MSFQLVPLKTKEIDLQFQDLVPAVRSLVCMEEPHSTWG